MALETLVNRQIDQYLIEKHIASGGMADVYLAKDVTLERPVAFKVMPLYLAREAELVARFQREAKIIARLNHPHIIQIYTTGLIPSGQPYLAMQYVNGGSLQEKLVRLAETRRPLPPIEALTIAHQIASALEAAHAAGIIHRDLKPSNILLQQDGAPIVSDFGIAAVREATIRLTQTNQLIGTPQYMSPEQGTGKKLDGRSDIYSLGVILYEMLAGAVPFAADSPLAVIHLHVKEPPPPLLHHRDDLAAVTYAVVETCLRKEPDRRYSSAAALGAALDQAISAEQDQPTPKRAVSPPAAPAAAPAPLTPSTLPSLRKLWWGYGLAAVILVLLGFSLYLLFAPPTPPEERTAVTATTTAADAALLTQATESPTALLTNPPTIQPSPTFLPSATPLPPPTETPPASDTPPPTAAATDTATPPARPVPALVPPTGKIVFTCFIDGNDELCLMNADGSNQRRMTNEPATDFYASLSPDGNWIAFSSRRSGAFLTYLLSVDGSQLLPLGPNYLGSVYGPAISPNGQRVAVAIDQDGVQTIWTTNLDGSDPVQITGEHNIPTAVTDAVWSPDGAQVAFAARWQGAMSHFIVNADGTGLRRIETDVTQLGGRSDWSPDGRWLAFYAGPRTDRHIYITAIGGGATYQLTRTGDNLGPSFSSDGNWIAFTSFRQGDNEIFIIRTDGSGETQLTDNGRSDWQPRWGP